MVANVLTATEPAVPLGLQDAGKQTVAASARHPLGRNQTVVRAGLGGGDKHTVESCEDAN